jgi:crotonobetainyl-CoA:carnitine CoA-transferase CaiB-like acyl-CoA transferase
MYAAYRCADGRDLMLVVVQDAEWRRLCGALGRPELGADPRYATALDRGRQSAALGRLLAEAFATRERDAWLAALAEADVPSAPVLEPGEVLESPQALANDMALAGAHPAAGRTVMVSQPVRVGPAAAPAPRPAPALGEHTAEVLRDLGYADAAIRDLDARGVIRCLAREPAAQPRS